MYSTHPDFQRVNYSQNCAYYTQDFAKNELYFKFNITIITILNVSWKYREARILQHNYY